MKVSKSIKIAAVVLAGFAPGLFAQAPVGTTGMELVSGGPYVLDNIYVGPYYALINNVLTPVICDDFVNDSFVPEEWTANVFTGPSTQTQMAGLSGFTQPTLTSAYNEVAYLAEEMTAAAPSNGSGNALTVGELDFALWNVFDPGSNGAIAYLNSTLGSTGYNASQVQTIVKAATADYNAAVTAVADGAAPISSYTIYSPINDQTGTCPTMPGGICPVTPPQEFLAATPEPEALATLGADFAGVGVMCYFVWRRRRVNDRP